MTETISIYDDHPLILEGLENFFANNTSSYQVISSYKNGNDIIAKVKTDQPDIILLDINLGENNGLKLCAEIHRAFPLIRIIGISGHEEPIIIKNFIENGGAGYVLKSEGTAEILKAIKATASGETYLCQQSRIELAKLNELNKQMPKLTRREREIISLIKEGKTINDIATELYISANTVITHRKNILSKFGCNNMISVINEVKDII